MPQPTARDRFLDLLRAALADGTLVKLTLGKPRGADPTLQNLFIRPVALKTGPHCSFLWRHTTRDITKNLPAPDVFAALEPLLGRDFLDAHLFTTTQSAQLETKPDGTARLKLTRPSTSPLTAATSGPEVPPVATLLRSASLAPSRLPPAHDRAKSHLIPADAPWLRALGVTNDRGHPREGMADKFRQIQKFAELLQHLIADAFPSVSLSSAVQLSTTNPQLAPPLRIVDMGSGKGYLTFALAHLLGPRAVVRGIEFRPELVELCNRIARDHQLADRLSFSAGTIADTPLAAGDCDVLIALHACDTATDDALARGVAAGARLLVVAPCCQKELRPQLTAPPVLADALRHGIFQERQAEFVTDALRAQLLEAVGHRTKVFEFISTEHTAKNLMIAATKLRDSTTPDPVVAERLRTFADFYGIRRQRLADHLGIALSPDPRGT